MPSSFVALRRFDDSNPLGKFERNGAGGLKLPVRLARTGIQIYRDAKGSKVREYRAPEEVFSEDSLASLASVPVTVGHPTGGVTADTWKIHSVGHVSELPTVRTTHDGEEWIESSAFVTDSDAISGVSQDKLREVSMGYTVEVVMQDGVTPSGEQYDAIQRNIRYNHLALLPNGHARAGRNARLTIDGHQDSPEPESRTMSEVKAEPVKVVVTMVTFDGKEYERGSAEHVEALTAKLDAADVAQAKSDAKVEELEEALKTSKADAEDVSRIDAAIAFRDDARKLLGVDYKFDGKSNVDVQKDAIAKVSPKTVLEGKSDAYVEARYDLALESYVDVKSDEDRAPEVKVTTDADMNARLNAGFAASFAKESK